MISMSVSTYSTFCVNFDVFTDFDCERRHIHDVVIPELQRYCNSQALDLLVIDSQWKYELIPRSHSSTYLDTNTPQHRSGVGPPSPSPAHLLYESTTEAVNPHDFALQLREIEDCYHKSFATFFLVCKSNLFSNQSFH